MKYLLRFFFGFMCISVPLSQAATLMDHIFGLRMVSFDGHAEGDRFVLSLPAYHFRKWRASWPGNDVTYTEHGLVPLIIRSRARAGLWLGAGVALVLLLLSGGRVWDVRVQGNHRLSEGRVREMLTESGLQVGMVTASLDRKEIASAMLRSSEELAWVSINMRGNVAYVELIERATVPDGDQNTHPANLVAGCDAVIDSMAVERGEARVSAGQVVSAGDLLVSGVTEGAAGARLVRAGGSVYGRVQHRYTITVPRNSEIETISEEKLTGFSLIFFGKAINIYAGTGNLPSVYDTIYNQEQLYLFGNTRLPFGFVQTFGVVREKTGVSYGEDALVSLAMRRMEETLAAELGQAELLSRRVTGYFTDEAYVLICDVECIEDIAKTVEFDIPQ